MSIKISQIKNDKIARMVHTLFGEAEGGAVHNIFVIITLTIVLLLSAACSSHDSEDIETVDDGKPATTTFALRTSTIDYSRDGGSNIEAMHCLRIIILHENGDLEINFSDENLNGVYEYTRTFEVTGNEKKKIYLIANEKSIISKSGVEIDWNRLGEDGKNVRETIENCMFVSQYEKEGDVNPTFTKNGIPMSSCYDIFVGTDSYIEKEFFVVRTATKFTFTFENGRTDNVTLQEMNVSAFADKGYLIPHFHDEYRNRVYSESFTVDAKGGYSSSSGLSWIKWLDDAKEKAAKGELSADEIGWLCQYTVPQDAAYETNNIHFTCEKTIKPGEILEYPVAFYRCESSYIPEGTSEQEYRIVRLTAQTGMETKTWEGDLPELKLDQVRYLFRDTHVKVDVVFNMTETVIFARIHPWVVLDQRPTLPFQPVTN